MSDTRTQEEFRERLANARLHLARTVASTDEDLETLAAKDSRETAEDVATGTVGDLLARLDAEGRRELEEIDAAQLRLEDGRYGICAACGETIALARLRALPTTLRCASCESAA